MPSFGNTPEKLLGRNDSKNPATTCKGITSNGRPCRRALASPKLSHIGRRNSDALNGVVALVQEDGDIQEADFYCWQHKDQAEQLVQDAHQAPKKRRQKRRSTELFPLQEKSSIDTMVQRFGLDAEEEKKAKKTKNPKPPRKTQTNDFAASGPSQAPHAQKYDFVQPAAQRPSRPKPKGFWASLCCVSGGDDDYVEIVRHKKRVNYAQQAPDMPASRPTSAAVPGRKPVASTPPRPAPPHRKSSNNQTNDLLSLIPQNLPPQTTSTLLAELVKPISPADEEGYIYIFWLTPQSNSQPSESTARSLLAPPSARPQNERRISDVITEFSFNGDGEMTRGGGGRGGAGTRGKKTIMLKIGRANNITRRMNEWQRQCGYALNLVRWYPHVSSSSSASNTPTQSPASTPAARRQSQQPLYPDLSRPPSHSSPKSRRGSESTGVKKVPYVKRVERLIHLELAEQRVLKECEACGKEHREWFEVEASERGVRGVDECVRRWVGWAEKKAAE